MMSSGEVYLQDSSIKREKLWLVLILFIAFLHGLIYVIIEPPWQHYDEPGHFEYVWLLADQPIIPGKVIPNQSLRREIAASMVENRFFEGATTLPELNLIQVGTSIWIGINQFDDFPSYYWLVSLPIRLIRYSDVTMLMYIARLVSLLMYLVTVLAAFGLAAEISPPGHPIRILLPLSLVMLPGFVDMMTAINNDVGAAMFMSLFLWAAAVWLRRGFSWERLISLTLLAVLAFFTKFTNLVVVLLFPIVLFSRILPRKWLSRLVWICLGITGLLIITMFDLNWLASWHAMDVLDFSPSLSSDQALDGTRIILVGYGSGKTEQGLFQPLGQNALGAIQGRKVVLGAWIWSDKISGQMKIPMTAPVLEIDKKAYGCEAVVTNEPQFISCELELPETISFTRVILPPVPIQYRGTSENGQDPLVYYDGVFLSPANQTPLTGTPAYENADVPLVVWNGVSLENLVKNGSGEVPWLGIRSPFNKILLIIPNGPLYLSSFSDIDTSMRYYLQAAKNLAQTFWARFGWGQVKLYYRPYTFLAIITLAGVLGALISFVRQPKRFPGLILAVLLICLVGVWVPVLMRGLQFLSGDYWMPSARYAFPAILPTMFILVIGWIEIIGLAQSVMNLILMKYNLDWLLPILVFCLFTAVDILAIYSLVEFWWVF